MAQDRIIKIELGLTRIESGRPTTAVLELQTGKGFRKGCRAHATVFWIGNGFKMTELFGDFSKTVATTEGSATQANIDRCHAKAFGYQDAIDAITAEVKAFYAAKAEKSEAA
jgi:hypothetical protein